MRALRLHLRAGGIYWFVILLSAVAVLVVLGRDRYWVGIWPETGASGQVPAFYLSIIGAGMAAWRSSAYERLNLVEQVSASSRSTASIDAYRLGAVLLVLLVPYVIGQLVAFALTARTFPVGVHLWVGYFLMGIVLILLGAALGWLLGQYLTPRFAALMSVLLWLVVAVWFADSNDLWVISGPTWEAASLTAMAVRMLAAVALLVLIVWPPRRSLRSSRPRLNGIAARFVAVAVAATAVVSTTAVGLRDVPPDPQCVPGVIDFCLWPEDAKYVSMIEEFDSKLSGLPSRFVLPERLDQYGLRRSTFTYAGEEMTQLGGIDISEGNPWALARGYSAVIDEQTFAGCERPFSEEAYSYLGSLDHWVELYLMGESEPDYQVAGAPQELLDAWEVAREIFTTRSPREQAEWANGLIDKVLARHCAG